MSGFLTQLINKKNETVITATLPPLVTKVLQQIALPAIGILVFLLVWTAAANNIETSLGKFPGPQQVAQQVSNLYQEHLESRQKEHAFYQRQEKRNAARLAQDPNYVVKIRSYTGKETFIDQISTRLNYRNEWLYFGCTHCHTSGHCYWFE